MATPIPDEQAALLAAIVAEPDDDTPRLVYADWLQEHDDEEQATFIRDWIGLEWLEDYEDDKRQKMAKRLDGAAVRNGLRWLDAVGVRPVELVYDRGMVDSVIYHGAESFVADAPLLFARVPVRDVTVHRMTANELDPEWLGVFAGMRELAALRALRLSNDGWPVLSGAWEQFITSSHLANLQLLSVQEVGLTDDDMHCFDRCEHLTNLEELGLSGNRLTASGSLTVVRSPRLPNLRRLGLAYNDIVEDRRRGSSYFALRDALIDRFDDASAMESVV